jgi:steroid delta-isomerase-like uncharacterized protein
MTEQDTIKLAQEMLDAHNAHDNSRLGATVTDDFIYHEFGTQRSVRGRQAWLDIWQGWRQTFPDVKGAITNIFVSGNQALAETVWDGTFQGALTTPGGTIPATGRRMEQFPVAFVYVVEGEKFKEVHLYFDLMSFLQQVGAMPQR